MFSNFERLQKIINQAYAENFMWNPEICQDAPNCGQDDLVLLGMFTTKVEDISRGNLSSEEKECTFKKDFKPLWAT